MRFVPLTSAKQQAAPSLRTARKGFTQARVAPANQIRELALEFDLAVPDRVTHLNSAVF
jgi:transposase